VLPAIANVTMPIAKFIHLMGEFMIADDRDDLFKTVYYGDYNHYYHGEVHPDHPSPFHHWMWGGFLVLTGQTLGALSMAREMYHMHKEGPALDIDNVPLPGGRRLSRRVIQIPYREARPALVDKEAQYQKLKRQLDSISKL